MSHVSRHHRYQSERGGECVRSHPDAYREAALRRPVATDVSRAAADNLNLMQTEDVSQFLIRALRLEDQMLATYGSNVGEYEKQLRAVKEIRIERIAKNHSQMMALVDCLEHLMPLTPAMRTEVQLTLRNMAVARQQAVNSDSPSVAEFWEVFDYLESLEEGPVVNHSADPKLIAINLNEFAKIAANNRQNIADLTLLREMLKESRRHKFIEANRTVHSVIRASARVEAFDKPRPSTLKCWIFRNRARQRPVVTTKGEYPCKSVTWTQQKNCTSTCRQC